MPHLLPPTKKSRFSTLLFLAVPVTLCLSWNHILPGGYWLRSLIQDQSAWDASRHEEQRKQRLLLFEQEKAMGIGSPSIVWLGSSTIAGFPISVEFPQALNVNRGIGGESLQEMRERLDVGWPEGEISLVLFYGGSADLRRLKLDPRVVAEEYRKTLRALREKNKLSKILAIEVLSARGKASEDSGARFQLFRELQREICKEEGIALIPTYRPPLINKDGELAAASSTDRYHLNGEGYKALATWIRDAAGEHLQ